jgi:hypothetical protein
VHSLGAVPPTTFLDVAFPSSLLPDSCRRHLSISNFPTFFPSIRQARNEEIPSRLDRLSIAIKCVVARRLIND